jgi:hypothetical protein
MIRIINGGRHMAGIKRTSVITIVASVLVGALIIVGFIQLNKTTNDAPLSPLLTTNEVAAPEAMPDEAVTTDTNVTDVTPATDDVPTVDPATLSFVDIEPLGIAIAYTKGTPGFEFTIKRTANQTQYIEFTSSDLVGTKCTDDDGLIVSIIKNPSSNEDRTTIDQTVAVGDDTYGISLASSGCTKNAELLDQYQKAFIEGFPSLKPIES